MLGCCSYATVNVVSRNDARFSSTSARACISLCHLLSLAAWLRRRGFIGSLYSSVTLYLRQRNVTFMEHFAPAQVLSVNRPLIVSMGEKGQGLDNLCLHEQGDECQGVPSAGGLSLEDTETAN